MLLLFSFSIYKYYSLLFIHQYTSAKYISKRCDKTQFKNQESFNCLRFVDSSSLPCKNYLPQTAESVQQSNDALVFICERMERIQRFDECFFSDSYIYCNFFLIHATRMAIGFVSIFVFHMHSLITYLSQSTGLWAMRLMKKLIYSAYCVVQAYIAIALTYSMFANDLSLNLTKREVHCHDFLIILRVWERITKIWIMLSHDFFTWNSDQSIVNFNFFLLSHAFFFFETNVRLRNDDVLWRHRCANIHYVTCTLILKKVHCHYFFYAQFAHQWSRKASIHFIWEWPWTLKFFFEYK